MEQAIFEEIRNIINNNNIVLFMKGTKQQPQCGFSAVVVQILNKFNIDFVTVNVLDNMEIREGIKQYSDWPTIPQLYIKQEFIGGCDIVKEMYQEGELEQLLRDKQLISTT